MPIYAYRCESCGHAKDVLQKMSDPVLSTCPSCGVQSFKKQLTAAGFQLKGSGWYATDFKGGASAGTAAATATEGSAATPAAGAASTAPTASTSNGTGASGGAASCGTSCACH